MFFDPCRLASAVNHRLDENGVTENGIENCEWKSLRKCPVIIPIHNTMNAAMNPQRFYISGEALSKLDPETRLLRLIKYESVDEVVSALPRISIVTRSDHGSVSSQTPNR
jgi:hypothetical protein